jgi:uncharacterized protein YyaL (SSP411 family)
MRAILAAALIAFVAGCRGADAPPAPALPGAAPFEPALATRLGAAARAAAGTARTRHRLPDGTPRYTNRLALERSPYLLQHAHNPVNWYPWGEDAFAVAAREGRPVLLSIGYSTCHWCHVMEEESFDDEEIAALLNSRYVAIKVDREERPDVDAVYMEAVQRLTGGGGWPLTVWLTPSRLPFYGGTYFPARDGERGRGPGFLRVLRTVADTFAAKPEAAASQATEIALQLRDASAAPPGDAPDAGTIGRAVAILRRGFDAEWGGFGRAPKFPRPATLELLLRHHRRTGDPDVLAMVTTTLDRMARGGIYDQLAGGFHRYATDARWRVPHFEKMLYDNAQLASVYLEAFQATGRDDFAAVARETLDWMARDMTSPEGGFYAATDADSPGGEGRFFVWTPEEVDAVVGAEQGRLVRGWFDVTGPDAVPWRPRALAEAAADLGVSPAALRDAVDRARPALLAARARRPPPATDEKILVAWNGLALSAFARGALVLDQPRYLATARRAATLLLDRLRRDGRLLHSLIRGKAGGAAFLDDYAFLIAGLLDLFEADADPRWLGDALALQRQLDADFRDADAGGYFFTAAGHETIIRRDKPGDDGALPAGNSVAALNLLRLEEYTGDPGHRERALGVMRALGPAVARAPGASPRLLVALDWLLDRPKEIIVVGSADEAHPLLDVVRRTFVPNRVLVAAGESGLARLRTLVPLLEGKTALGGRATAFVCEAGRCDLPTGDPAVLSRQLAKVEPLRAP